MVQWFEERMLTFWGTCVQKDHCSIEIKQKFKVKKLLVQTEFLDMINFCMMYSFVKWKISKAWISLKPFMLKHYQIIFEYIHMISKIKCSFCLIFL